jgi:photosystem II stability/assembly factor-like uncharacterized protein
MRVREVVAVVLLLLTGAVSVCRAGDLRADQDDADLHAIARVGQRVAWAVGDRGVAWTTRDGGHTWSAVPLPGQLACRSVCFLSNRVGWIGGNDERPGHSRGVLLSTRDGGASWQSIETPLGRLSHVRFFDLQRGVLVGGGSEEHPSGVVETSDGGRSWQAVQGAESDDWRTAAFSSNQAGVVAGGGLRIGTLANGAVLESNPQSRGRRAWWGAAVSEGGPGWLVGDGASVLLRPPRQAIWQTPSTPLPAGLADAMTFRCVAALGTRAWIAGSPGSAIWHTSDGGDSWQRQSTGQSLPIYGISMGRDGAGVAVGGLGVIIRTSDGGRHWQVVRGRGRRLAMLVIHVSEKTLPLGVVARDSAELGYRSRGMLITGSPAQWRRADRTLRALGGQGVEAGWRLQLDAPEVTGDPQRLEQTWQAATEGRLDDWLVGRCVGLIRTWRPSVVIVDAASARDHAARLVHSSVVQATQQAADPTQWAVHASLTGLVPWTTRRLYQRTADPGSVSVRVQPSTSLTRLGDVVGTRVQQSLLHGSGFAAATWAGDRLVRLQGTGKSSGDSACQGLGLARGSAARRDVPGIGGIELASAEAHARRNRALDAWVRLAESGARPPESLAAELMPLLSAMGSHRGGWSLWRLAERFRAGGRLPLAESLLTELIDRYPAHEAAPAATMQLLASTISRERRWQRLRKTGSQDIVAAPRVKPPGRKAQPGAADIVSRTRQRPLQNAARADWQSEMTRAEVDRAIRLARSLKQTASRTYDSATTQLTLASLFRARGSHRLADGCYRRLAGRPGPWRSAAVQETWLAIRSGNPPSDSVTCPSVASRPIIDGVISDRCWEAVPEMRLRGNGRLIDSEGTGFVVTACDSEYLYLAARLERNSASGAAVAAGRRFDADHTGFDRVTVFLDTDRDYQIGYELTVDERGEVSERCGGDPAWNPRCSVAVDIDEKVWRFELAIRWSELVSERPAAGARWGLRLVRTIPAVGWQGWGGSPDGRGAPVIGAGFMSFSGDATARRRR